MPMYEYACTACGHTDTLIEKINAAKSKKCPACSKARAFTRQLSAPAFHLKGSGWYATDFRDKKPTVKDESEAKESLNAKKTEKAKDKPAATKEKKAKDTAAAATT